MWVGDCVHTVIPPWGVFVNAVGFQGFQFVARPRSGVYVCVCVRACALWCLNYAGEMPAWCIIGRLTENDQVKCIWKLDLQLGHYTKWIFFFFLIPFNKPCQAFFPNFFYITGKLLKDVLSLRNLFQLFL